MIVTCASAGAARRAGAARCAAEAGVRVLASWPPHGLEPPPLRRRRSVLLAVSDQAVRRTCAGPGHRPRPAVGPIARVPRLDVLPIRPSQGSSHGLLGIPAAAFTRWDSEGFRVAAAGIADPIGSSANELAGCPPGMTPAARRPYGLAPLPRRCMLGCGRPSRPVRPSEAVRAFRKAHRSQEPEQTGPRCCHRPCLPWRSCAASTDQRRKRSPAGGACGEEKKSRQPSPRTGAPSPRSLLL